MWWFMYTKATKAKATINPENKDDKGFQCAVIGETN